MLVAGSVLGASAVTLATSYAVGDYFGLRHSLHRRWREARTFHRTYAACVLAAAAVVLIPQVPLGLLTTAVQALAGILLPSATVFLLLLCNDREVLGPLVNPRLAPAVTGLAVTITVLAACTALLAIRARPAPAPAPGTDDRRTWTMPPIESLRPPARSAWRTLGLAHARPGRPPLLPACHDRRPGRAGHPDRAGRGILERRPGTVARSRGWEPPSVRLKHLLKEQAAVLLPGSRVCRPRGED